MEGGEGAKEGGGESSSATASLTDEEREDLRGTIMERHTYKVTAGQCSSLLVQRVNAPAEAVWSVIRRFDRPQVYKHFIRSCSIKDDDGSGVVRIGCLREVSVISGLPASTSTERLDILDDARRIAGFSIIGGEHRLKNYRSVTSVTEFRRSDGVDERIWSVVLESYVVDVPEGNSEEDTRLFADTVVRLNLQKLASVAEVIAGDRAVKGYDGDEEDDRVDRQGGLKKRARGID
ncbi:polyketide cyclase/dehydrase and lipid transport superfamily protein [Wolffia australiana]